VSSTQEASAATLDDEPWVFTPQEAAAKLKISRSKVYELISQGELPAVRIGSRRRIVVATLRQWIEEQTVTY
jgi:excisionase family DNA binding protein